MKPIQFPESNCTYAKDQKEYLPLPAHKTECGIVTSCWKLSILERLKVALRGKIWWSVFTFNRPLQPQLPLSDKPDFVTEESK